MKASDEMSLTSNLTTDPENGVVYGARGKPIGSVKKHGYVEVWNGVRHVLAHRVVWESVHGKIIHPLQVNHINGIKTDNRISNLELVTPSENLRHAHRIGIKPAQQGVDRPNAKLTESDIRAIRVAPGKQVFLGGLFGVHPSIISEIKSGKRWAHVL